MGRIVLEEAVFQLLICFKAFRTLLFRISTLNSAWKQTGTQHSCSRLGIYCFQSTIQTAVWLLHFALPVASKHFARSTPWGMHYSSVHARLLKHESWRQNPPSLGSGVTKNELDWAPGHSRQMIFWREKNTIQAI